MQSIKAYRVKLTRAYAMYELGGAPWYDTGKPVDTNYYEHDCEEVTIALPDGYRCLETKGGTMAWFAPDSEGGGMDLMGLIDAGIATVLPDE